MKGILIYHFSGQYEPECNHDSVYAVPANATDEQIAEFVKSLGGNRSYVTIEILNLGIVTKQALSIMQE